MFEHIFIRATTLNIDRFLSLFTTTTLCHEIVLFSFQHIPCSTLHFLQEHFWYCTKFKLQPLQHVVDIDYLIHQISCSCSTYSVTKHVFDCKVYHDNLFLKELIHFTFGNGTCSSTILSKDEIPQTYASSLNTSNISICGTKEYQLLYLELIPNFKANLFAPSKNSKSF
jgi:hypothetical protein